MQGRIIFLVEEPSMKELLDKLLPRLFPGWVQGQHFLCIKHEGKSDLDRSIPLKMQAWRVPADRFVIVRDNDNADCVAVKARLVDLCRRTGRNDVLVRMVCQELESWYLGDLEALSLAFELPNVNSAKYRKRYSEPDQWQRPSVEIERMIPGFQKISGARRMAGTLRNTDHNQSASYRTFLTGISLMAKEMGWQCP